MTVPPMMPRLKATVQRHRAGAVVLLRCSEQGTWLAVPLLMVPILDGLDGDTALPDLEARIHHQEGLLAYRALIGLLQQLWDRGMLANGDEVRAALFPHLQHRTLDRLGWGRRLWSLVVSLWPLIALSRVAGALGWLGRALSTSAGLTLMAVIGVVGMWLYGPLLLKTDLFFHHDSAAVGLGWLYGLASLALSVRGLTRAMVLAGLDNPFGSLGLQFTLGVAHLDVSDREAFHRPRGWQVRFALAAIVTPLAVATILASFSSSAELLGRAALLLWVVVFVDLCPFLPTSGSRLVEQTAALHKQRFRVRSFVRRRLLRGLFSARAMPEDETHRVLTAVWALWFFAALHCFSVLVVVRVIPLQVGILGSRGWEDALASAVMFVYAVVGGACFLAVIGVIGFGVLVQIMTPERVSKPVEADTSALTSAQEAVLRDHLRALGFTEPDVQDQMISAASVQCFREGAWVARSGLRQMFFVVLSGEVQVLRVSSDGVPTPIHVLGPEMAFGEDSLFGVDGGHDCRALSEVTLIAVQADTSNAGVAHRIEQVDAMASELASYAVFSGTDEAARLVLASRVTPRAVSAGEQVVSFGAQAESMFLIRAGRVAVHRPADGGDERVAELDAGQAFGEMGLMFERPRTASVTALDDAELLEIPKTALEALVLRSFDARKALQQLADRRENA